jgi:hypothetical protein
MSTKTTIITTLKHNVGDDFVREGILHLLRQVSGDVKCHFIHKHIPLTSRRELSWIYDIRFTKFLDKFRSGLGLKVTSQLDRLPIVKSWDKVHDCELLIQSGAPAYWINAHNSCDNNEWWNPLIERRWDKRRVKGQFMNIAVGTCQHYDSDGSEFEASESVLNYIRLFHEKCAVTTVRDKLSAKILKLAGIDIQPLPCTSIFAGDELGVVSKSGEYVALNYMRGGGHYEFGQKIDVEGWERTFVEFVTNLSKKENCVMICHDLKELALARRILPKIPIRYSSHHRDYLEFYSMAKYGILNRVHGAFAMGSMGKPSVVIGADSRARMAGMIGLESVFVNDANRDFLERSVANLTIASTTYPAVMEVLKIDTRNRYVSIFKKGLSLE